MALEENKELIKKRFHPVYEFINKNEKDLKENVNYKLVEAKSGHPTVEVKIHTVTQTLHSKYNPIKEAERLIDNLELQDIYSVFFYGIGLGYHIEEFIRKHSTVPIYIYEPNPFCFYHFMNCIHAKKILEHPNLKKLYVQESQESAEQIIFNSVKFIQNSEFIDLPIYSRLFPEELGFFHDTVKQALSFKKASILAESFFQKKWTVNSLMNMSSIYHSESIFDKKKYFKEKPVIIASAGPSLQAEYENLKYIKEYKLAYIFAVGSANKALLVNGITPDAVCTYDPQEHNVQVFEELFEEGHDKSIPMIFGTCVGYETVERHRGPKLHMVTNQDILTHAYLKRKDGKNHQVVNDATTIANVVYQLLDELECSMIILVGQNFSFRDEQYYAKGVSYQSRNEEVSEQDLDEVTEVASVDGGTVSTNYALNIQREELEILIAKSRNSKTINATKKGAAIKGAEFHSLENLIETKLVRSVVDNQWFEKVKESYDRDYLVNRLEELEKESALLQSIYSSMEIIFNKMLKGVKSSNRKVMAKQLELLNHELNKIERIGFYQTFLAPMNRVASEQVEKKIQQMNHENDIVRKGKIALEAFQSYVYACRHDLAVLKDYLNVSHTNIRNALENKPLVKTKKYEVINQPALTFDGHWLNQVMNEYKFRRLHLRYTTGKVANLSFQFTGSFIRIYGLQKLNTKQKISWKIDGVFIDKEIVLTSIMKDDLEEVVIELKNLNDESHQLELILDDNEWFGICMIELPENGRLLHKYEVTEVEDLQKGKLIRAHYDTKVRKFSHIGEEKSRFMSYHLRGRRKGDVYFLIIDRDVDGAPLLIADREIEEDVLAGRLYKLVNIEGKNVLQETTGRRGHLLNFKGRKSYPSNYGALEYKGKWKRYTFINFGSYNNLGPYSLGYQYTITSGTILTFDFIGNMISLSGYIDKDSIVKITVDGKEELIRGNRQNFNQNGNEKLSWYFQLNNLESMRHKVKIKLFNESFFALEEIKIDENERILHKDEVTSMEELENGKQIRCHYKASHNKVGIFEGFAEETNIFISPESSANPDGDFYFIMVDEADSTKKLIADRNIQHSISWDTLDDYGLVNGISECNFKLNHSIRLMYGGCQYIDEKGLPVLVDKGLGAYPANNEWDKYISKDDNSINKWHWEHVESWCLDEVAPGFIQFNGGIAEEGKRMCRGSLKKNQLIYHSTQYPAYYVGFRPVLELL